MDVKAQQRRHPMRATTALTAFSAAIAIIVTSCDSGSTHPSAPKDEGKYCAYNKNNYNDYNYYNFCPSVLCAYTGYNMTGYDYDNGKCVPPVASSSSTPRSSSSVRPRTSSSSTCPTTKCDCNQQFHDIVNTLMHTAAGASLGNEGVRNNVAQQVGCTL